MFRNLCTQPLQLHVSSLILNICILTSLWKEPLHVQWKTLSLGSYHPYPTGVCSAFHQNQFSLLFLQRDQEEYERLTRGKKHKTRKVRELRREKSFLERHWKNLAITFGVVATVVGLVSIALYGWCGMMAEKMKLSFKWQVQIRCAISGFKTMAICIRFLNAVVKHMHCWPVWTCPGMVDL